MRVIGITGGVGAGKTKILSYIEKRCRCKIVRADEVAHFLYEKGQECYEKISALFGDSVLAADGELDRKKLAAIIFNDDGAKEKVNAIVHPAVKRYIIEQIAKEREKGEADFFFIEAALLIEEHYDEIADELWYVHADEALRKARLGESRGYSEQKSDGIMRGQLSSEEFMRKCQRVITNNGDLADTYKQIDELLKMEEVHE